MSGDKIPVSVVKETAKRAWLAGVIRALDLKLRVPEFMKKRGWPVEDQDLFAVIIVSIALRKLGAGATVVRRPKGADALQGLWPEAAVYVTASHVVDTLELDDLLIV